MFRGQLLLPSGIDLGMFCHDKKPDTRDKGQLSRARIVAHTGPSEKVTSQGRIGTVNFSRASRTIPHGG